MTYLQTFKPLTFSTGKITDQKFFSVFLRYKSLYYISSLLLSLIYRRNMLTPKHKPYLPFPKKKPPSGQQHQTSFTLTPRGFPVKSRLSVELVRKQLSPIHNASNISQKLQQRVISHTHLQYSHEHLQSKASSPTNEESKMVHSLSCKHLERRQIQSTPTSQENIEVSLQQTMSSTIQSFGNLIKKTSQNSNLSKQNIRQSTGYKFFKRQASNNTLLEDKNKKELKNTNISKAQGFSFSKNYILNYKNQPKYQHTNQLRKCLPNFIAFTNQIPAPLLSKTGSSNQPNSEKWEQNTATRNSCKQFLNRSILSYDKEVTSLLSVKDGNHCIILNLDQFILGNCKGQGRYGKVYHAIHKKTGWNLAIKKIKKETIRPIAQQFLNQLKIQYSLNHPNIIKLYGYFDDREYIYLLLQYMEQGSLYKLIKKQQKLEEEESIQKLAEVCEAVAFMHRNDILHRDIKPQNIVISHGVCKLCDFGWSVCTKGKRKTCCGTLDYTCPQVASGASYSKQIDIWALGVLAFEMLTGKPPFYHFSRQKTMTFIRNCDFQIPSYLSQNARNFILKILNKDSCDKVRIDELLADVFLQNIDKSYIL